MAAVEQLSLTLEDEREQIKALKRKHMSNTKDLQRQIAHCKRSAYHNTLSITVYLALLVCRRMEQLESQIPVDRESPATLPITEGSRASSHSSIEALPPSTLTTHHRAASPEDGEVHTDAVHAVNRALK